MSTIIAHRYRKKPVEVEAMQFDGTSDSANLIIDWMYAFGGEADFFAFLSNKYGDVVDENPFMRIQTLEGTMIASRNDYVIRGVKGEFYPCKPDIFAATYELVA